VHISLGSVLLVVSRNSGKYFAKDVLANSHTSCYFWQAYAF